MAVIWGGCTVIIRQRRNITLSPLIPVNHKGNMEVDNGKYKRKDKRHFQNMSSEKLPNTDLVFKLGQYPTEVTDFKGLLRTFISSA